MRRRRRVTILRHLLTAIFAVAVLGVSYVWTFGVPAPVAQFAPFLAPDTQSAEAESANRPTGRGSGRTTSVVLQSLGYRPYTATIQAIGSARSWRRTEVLAETSGRVTEVLMTANKKVEAGDVLVKLDDRTQKLDLDVAKAQAAQEEANMDRFTRLRADGSLTVSDVTITEAELALTLAQAEVEQAEVALERRTIRAPFKGSLGLQSIEVGDLIEISDPIVSVDDTDTLLVEFELPERSISMLELGRTVLASTPSYAGRVFEAEIVAFDSRINSATRTVSVEARIDNSDGVLWSGMTFAVRLLSNTDAMPAVPATALNWARHGAGVWAIKDGKAERHPVTIRFRQGGDVWIETDLPEGATVVVEGAAKLREGAAVEAVNQDSDPDAPIQAAIPSAPVEPQTPEGDEDPA